MTSSQQGGAVMTDVVDLLERMGETGCFDSIAAERIAQELECLGGDDSVRVAVQTGDVNALRSVLGLRPMTSLVMPAEEEDDEGEEEKEGVPPPQEPSSGVVERPTR